MIHLRLLTLVGLLIFVASHAVAQLPRDPNTKNIIFQETVETAGTKKLLFKNAQEWAQKKFKLGEVYEKEIYHHKTGVQNYDPSESKIVAIGHTYLNTGKTGKTSYKIWFTITIDVKEDRYRYTIDNFEMQESGRKYSSTLYLGSFDVNKAERDINDRIKELTNSLKSVMKDSDKW